VLLTLPEDPQRYPVAGKVAWITPRAPPGNRAPGRRHPLSVGRKIAPAEGAHRGRILGGSMASDRPTQTI
jgi:type IV pilus assembly protein PilZ